MSEHIWTIMLSRLKNGRYRISIRGDDPLLGMYNMKSVADGKTPHQAYISACAKLVIKPWLDSTGARHD